MGIFTLQYYLRLLLDRMSSCPLASLGKYKKIFVLNWWFTLWWLQVRKFYILINKVDKFPILASHILFYDFILLFWCLLPKVFMETILTCGFICVLATKLCIKYLSNSSYHTQMLKKIMIFKIHTLQSKF